MYRYEILSFLFSKNALSSLFSGGKEKKAQIGRKPPDHVMELGQFWDYVFSLCPQNNGPKYLNLVICGPPPHSRRRNGDYEHYRVFLAA